MEELELTFLPKNLPEGVKSAPYKEMLDIYIPSSAEHPIVRIRKTGDKFEVTKKYPVEMSDSSRQTETTIKLTQEEYGELAQINGKRVEKVRFYYRENGTNYEIDVFGGDLGGLILVDVEFKSLEEKSEFIPPNWCLVNVTQEEFIAGGALAGKKYSDIERKLRGFGYKKKTFKLNGGVFAIINL